MAQNQVVIIGAGLAGLACAMQLRKKRIPFLIVESADAPGGRIRTDIVEGFRLDRGFQVLLTAYPEARRVLQYQELKLKLFCPGALVRYQGRYHRVCDPFRDPAHLLDTLFSPIGTLTDKLGVARLRLALNGSATAEPECFTFEALKKFGFSDALVERFFRPFFGGVFLEGDLATSSRNFEFLFRMFSSGDTGIPEHGMEEIPRQLASAVGAENIRLNTRVRKVVERRVELTSGEIIEAPNIVVATEASQLSNLLGDARNQAHDNAVVCLYFAADAPPFSEPILVLNGDGEGVINNLCVPSVVSPSYAPAGKSLISVTVLGNPAESDDLLLGQVQKQLSAWYGVQTEQWRHLRTYRIKHALPQQFPVRGPRIPPRYEVRDGLYVCGDHLSIGSINGALESGRLVGEMLTAKVEQSATA